MNNSSSTGAMPLATCALRTLLDQNMQNQNHFKMIWTGHKNPNGGEIGGIKIKYAQNGIIVAHNGDWLGTYTRDVEFGGPDKQSQEISIATKHNCATNPDGSNCVRID